MRKKCAVLRVLPFLKGVIAYCCVGFGVTGRGSQIRVLGFQGLRVYRLQRFSGIVGYWSCR